mgnify:CR=1 FL=1
MYNQIYSIVDDFIKAVEQDKNFSSLLRNWERKARSKKKTFNYTGYITESFKVYNSYQGPESIS